jgi:hypothetical protein
MLRKESKTLPFAGRGEAYNSRSSIEAAIPFRCQRLMFKIRTKVQRYDSNRHSISWHPTYDPIVLALLIGLAWRGWSNGPDQSREVVGGKEPQGEEQETG